MGIDRSARAAQDRASRDFAGVVSIILGERPAQTVVDRTEHDGVREDLGRARATRWQREEDTRGEEDKKKHGDDNVQIHFVRSHEFIRSTTMPLPVPFLLT